MVGLYNRFSAQHALRKRRFYQDNHPFFFIVAVIPSFDDAKNKKERVRKTSKSRKRINYLLGVVVII